MPLANFNCEGTLTIGGFSMTRLAWTIQGDENGLGGLLPLLITADVRGDDRLLPTAPGVIAYQRRRTVTRHNLRLVVVGDTDPSGNPTTDAKEGLIDNLEAIKAAILTQPGTNPGTRNLVYTPPSTPARSAAVHILRLDTTRYHLDVNQAIYVGNLAISIPDGWITP